MMKIKNKLFLFIILMMALRVVLAAGLSPSTTPDAIRTLADTTAPYWPRPIQAPTGAPNIVIILLDDVGFAASRLFGGQVQTPTMEDLASRGLRYNGFHVAALCSSTRASLLTGRNEHRVGFGTISDAARGYPGYNGIWKKSTASVVEVLRRNGYSTAAFGKWHNTPFSEITPVGPFERWPTGLGFEYFYGFMSGADSQWEPVLYRNTTLVDPSNAATKDFHVTTSIVDDAVAWLHTHRAIAVHKPYLLYLAPGATHDPLHVSREWIEKYRGQFEDGWDKFRDRTFRRQKQLGVIPRDTKLTPRPDEIPAWRSLTADQQALLARQMEVYAAFLEHTDYEVGRLLKAIGETDDSDNTLILYIAGDNGAAAFGGVEGFDVPPPIENRLKRMDDIGSKDYWNLYSAGWAWATSTPFKWWKSFASHFGGTRSPLIVSWPAKIKDGGSLRSQFTHVNDVAATLYEATGIASPDQVDGVKQVPLDGVSLVYTFNDASAPSRHRSQVFEQLGNRAIYQDGWVAAARHTFPLLRQENKNGFEMDTWELYDVEDDFSQARDLASKFPAKLQAMKVQFETQAQAGDILPLGWWADQMAEPGFVDGRKQFIYWDDQAPIPVEGVSIPDFGRSYRIVADVIIPESGAEGILLSVGGRLSGLVFYVKDDHLIFEMSSPGAGIHETLVSTATIPRGRAELAFQFDANEAGPQRGKRRRGGAGGVGRLYIDDQLVGEGKVPSFIPFRGTLDVGRGRVSPVSDAYRLPFRFSGAMGALKIDVID